MTGVNGKQAVDDQANSGDPLRAARDVHRKPRRFYDRADVVATELGFAIALDGRRIKTPARNPLVVPREALAREIAGEWQAQGDEIESEIMPLLRFANTAIDNVSGRITEVVGEMLAYARSDLLCYRAETPEALVVRQAKAWDPVLAWANTAFEARFVVTTGVVHVAQPEAVTANVERLLLGQDPHVLTGLHNLMTLSGSVLLALAIGHGHIDCEQAWALAHIDEDWQGERWGTDQLAIERRSLRRHEFRAAARYLDLSGGLVLCQ